MKTALVIAALAFAILLTGCGKSTDSSQAPSRTVRLKQPDMPKTLKLFHMEPVLVAQLEATPTGYALQSFRGRAAPAPNLNQDDGIQVIGWGQDNRPVAITSLKNPLLVRTSGTDTNQFGVLDHARLTVFLPKPDDIRRLEVRVMSGPGQGYSTTFDIQPKELKDYIPSSTSKDTNAIGGPRTEPKR